MELQTQKLFSQLYDYDADTAIHCRRTSSLVLTLCGIMGVPPHLSGLFAEAAYLHDIGKLHIPREVLHKREPLTFEERRIIRQHARYSAKILGESGYPSPIVQAVLHHHERWDGGGYPAGLKGDAIPLGAKILAPCDSIDAMLHQRCYRGAMLPEACHREILLNKGMMYAPAVTETILAHWDAIQNVASKYE